MKYNSINPLSIGHNILSWKLITDVQSTKYPKYSGRIQSQTFLFSTGIITNSQEKVIEYS